MMAIDKVIIITINQLAVIDEIMITSYQTYIQLQIACTIDFLKNSNYNCR